MAGPSKCCMQCPHQTPGRTPWVGPRADRPRRRAVWTSGLVQTALYLDFFYYYILAWKNNKKLSLPS